MKSEEFSTRLVFSEALALSLEFIGEKLSVGYPKPFTFTSIDEELTEVLTALTLTDREVFSKAFEKGIVNVWVFSILKSS